MFSGASLFRRSAMRYALTLSGLFVVVLALCGIWMLVQIQAEVREEIDIQLREAHADLSRVSEAELLEWYGEDDDLAFFTEGFRAADGTILGALRGEVFDQPGYSTLTAQELFAPGFLTSFEGLMADEAITDSPEDIEQDLWRVYVAPASGGQLATFESITSVEEALGLIPRVMITVGIALVTTTLIAGAFLAWGQQKRLNQISDGIARIGRGDLSHPMAPARVRDDLDQIMVGMDDAAAELDSSIGRLRLFSQNIAHELRTPLARLRATLEDGDAPQNALDRTDEVIRVLDAVQRIARLSHKADPGTLSPVDLGAVAQLMEELFAEVAADQSQTLQVIVQDPATVMGDYQLLAQMMSNLAENAIRYAGAGAQITVTADATGLSVRDTGPGITTDADLTEPFARADHVTEGTGLGLALVKTIAQHHGAELSMTSSGGLEARVDFPAHVMAD